MWGGQHVRGNSVARSRGGLKDKTCDIYRIATAVAVLLVMCEGLPNTCNVEGVGTTF